MDFLFPTVPTTVALAAVAALGYLFGRRNKPEQLSPAMQARRELRRAKVVAKELEGIAEELRHSLAAHHGSVARFKDRVSGLVDSPSKESWTELCGEAEEMLQPTMRLSTQIAHAYDQIRQQTSYLMTLSEVRTDPLTGMGNRRAMDESLEQMFTMLTRYQRPFALAIFDIDHFKSVNDQRGHLFGDQALRDVAQAINEAARDTDFVARHGGEEFVVIMPNTPLEGALIYAQRVRIAVNDAINLTVSGGAAEALDGDDPQSLLTRADEALYGAKAGGRNLVYYHNGETVLPAPEEDPIEDMVQTVQ